MSDLPFVDVGVVILPDLLTAAQAIELSAEVLPSADLQDEQPQIRLSLDRACRQFPHVSLFHLRVRAEKLPELGHALESLVAPVRPVLHGTMTGSKLVHRQWAFWCAEPTPVLVDLHHAALELFAPLRDADITDPAEPDLTESQRDAARRFGFINAGNAYDPHITFGYVRPDVSLPAVERREWHAVHVALARLGPRGTVVKLLKVCAFARP